MMAFNAESGKDHLVDGIPVQIYEDNRLIDTNKLDINLVLSPAEIKKDILDKSVNVPNDKRDAGLWDIYYEDDEVKSLIANDVKDLLDYEECLCCNNSHITLRYPRGASVPPPQTNLNNIGVVQK